MALVYVELRRDADESEEEYHRRRLTLTLNHTLREVQRSLYAVGVHPQLDDKIDRLRDAVEDLASVVEAIV